MAAPEGHAPLSTSSSGADDAGWTRAPQRPRAGTMPSTFQLAVGSGASSSRGADPLAAAPDGLLSPALGRRLSGNPLSTSAAAAQGAPAPSKVDGNIAASSATAIVNPSNLSTRSALAAASLPQSTALKGSAALAIGIPVTAKQASSSNISPPGPSLMPASSSSTTAPLPSLASNGAASPLELRASLLKSSQPISPDPVAAARLRSGSLTLPPSGLGNGFIPGFYGPPGSGTGTWTPRSTGMGTPLAMPTSSAMIPEEHLSADRESSSGALSPTEDSDHHPPPTAIGGILDFLDSDESTLPSSANTTSPHLPHPPARSVGSVTPRHTSPTSARTGLTSSGSLLSAGTRPHAASLSNPPSAHPSVQNLRQAYTDLSNPSPMQFSTSTTSAPDTPMQPLSPRSAARLRANTIAASDPPIIRRSSPYYLSPSIGSSSMNGSSIARSSYDGDMGTEGPATQLLGLSLNDQEARLQTRDYDRSYASVNAHNYNLLNANRPRASTIGILDEANAMTPNRRRAGTTGPNILPSGLRTPIYDGGGGGYLGAAPVTESEEEHYNSNGQGDPWASSQAQNVGYLNESYTAPVQFGDRSATPPPSQPTRSLWIGNIDSRVTSQDVLQCFRVYGHIESVRLLPEKECAFVNFLNFQDAIMAKEDVLNRLHGQLETRSFGPVTVRIGFGKTSSAPATPAQRLQGSTSSPMMSLVSHNSSSEPSIQTAPTRALWVGSIPSTITSADLLKIFSPYGPIESARVLVHKQCGFINFENLDDAVAARKILNGQDILGPEIGPIKIGFAKVPSKMPETPAYDNSVNPTAAYQALKRLGGASTVPLDEQLSAGHLENFRSPMALQLAANDLNGIGPHSAAGLTLSLQAAVGLSPSVVATEFGGEGQSPQGVPLPSISEQQILVKELSGNDPDAEAHAQAIAEPRPAATYAAAIPPPVEEHAHLRPRSFDTPRLRDIRKRLEAPPGQISQAEIDTLANELLDDCVMLSSDYIGNVIIQKLFERCSSTFRLALLERIAPHLAGISCHKNGTWAAQKILDTVSTPPEITLICRNLQPYVPLLLLDQFGNYAAQLSLRFFSPMSDFLFDAMIDRCWEIASGRFGARSMRTCLEHPNVTRLQHKRVAVSIILNSVNLATNPNGALLLTWLLDTSSLPGRYRLLATRLAPHLAQLCPHKVASTTILKIVNQKVDVTSSRMLVDAIFSEADPSILEDILSEQVHGSSFMHKLLGSVYISTAVRERGVQRVKDILQKGTPHHSPAYAKLCYEVGIQPPPGANGLPHTPPPYKTGGRHAQAGVPFPLTMHPHPPHTAGVLQNNGNPNSPAFSFPSFGSPLSPPPRSAPGAPPHSYLPRQASPFPPIFGRGDDPSGRVNAQGYLSAQPSPYATYASQPSPVRGLYGKPDGSPRLPAMMPSLAPHSQHNMYADQYLQNMNAMQMAGFTGYDGYQHGGMPALSPFKGDVERFYAPSPYPNGQPRHM